MTRWSSRLLTAGLAVLLCAVGPARAELIVPFSYNWVEIGPIIPAFVHNIPISISAGGSGSAVAPTSIVAANLSVLTSTDEPNVDQFTHYTYQLNLSIKDSLSNRCKTLFFSGELNGSANTTSLNLTNVYTRPSEQEVQLGSFFYDILLLPPTLAPIKDGRTQGSIIAHVSIAPLIPIQNAPEPSALLLLSVTLPVVGAAACMRRFWSKIRCIKLA
ncbi:MAG: hypothetical protein ACRD36_04955 [Candidatus Acidiferrum sp.]